MPAAGIYYPRWHEQPPPFTRVPRTLFGPHAVIPLNDIGGDAIDAVSSGIADSSVQPDFGQTPNARGNYGLFDSATTYVGFSDDDDNYDVGDGSWTFTLWCNHDGSGGNMRLVSKGGSQDTLAGYNFGRRSLGSLNLECSDGTTRLINNDFLLPNGTISNDGRWYFIVVGLERGVGAFAYAIDTTDHSIVSGTDAYTGTENFDASQPFNIGRLTSNAAYWGGGIQDVRLWKRTLSFAEVMEQYNAGFANYDIYESPVSYFAVPAAAAAEIGQVPQGVFSLSGFDAAALVTDIADIPQGVFALTGFDFEAEIPNIGQVPQGIFALTGFDFLAKDTDKAIIPQGAFLLAGFDFEAEVPWISQLPAGAFLLAGFDFEAEVPWLAQLPQGAFLLTGFDFEAEIPNLSKLPQGAFSLVGFDFDAVVSAGEAAVLPQGIFTLVGFGPAANNSSSIGADSDIMARWRRRGRR